MQQYIPLLLNYSPTNFSLVSLTKLLIQIFFHFVFLVLLLLIFLSYRALVNRTYVEKMPEPIKLDLVGDKINSAYEIFNLQTASNGSKSLLKIGDFQQHGNVTLDKNSILWPGGQTVEPKGVFISSHLQVYEFQKFIIYNSCQRPVSCLLRIISQNIDS